MIIQFSSKMVQGLLLVLLSTSAIAADYGNLTVQKVISVYDGDTFKVDIDGLHPLIGRGISIRVNGIDTPEIRGKCEKEKELAIKARDYVKSQLLSATNIELRNVQRGKYFRIVADVYIDGVNLTLLIKSKALGVNYQGGKKHKKWCDI